MSQHQAPGTLETLTRKVWLRTQSLHFFSGGLSFLKVFIPLFLGAMIIDWLIHLPAILRVILFASILAPGMRSAWRAGWKYLRSFNAVHTALQIENTVGNMNSLFVSALQLPRGNQSGQGLPPMLQKIVEDASEAGAKMNPQSIVKYDALQRPLKLAIIPLVLLVCFTAWNGPFIKTGFLRIFPPWSSIPYPTRTQMVVASENTSVVKEGSEVQIRAELSAHVPKTARLELRTGEGKPRQYTLPVENNVCSYTMASAYRSFEYRLKAGDARSPWYFVEVIPPPRIEQANVSIHYPEYTQKEPEDLDALTFTAPETSTISWRLKLDRAVSKAECQYSNGTRQELAISEDGMTVSMDGKALQSQSYHFAWTEKAYGFVYEGATHYLQVSPDNPPRVELTYPTRNLFATLGRKLPLAFRASDDHGIGEAKLVYHINKTEDVMIPLKELPEINGSELAVNWDYREVLTNLVVGDSLSLSLEVADRYPPPDGPHRVLSQSRRITFLTREEYLDQVARQRKRMLLQLRSIYRDQRQVYTSLQELEPSDSTFKQTCQLEAVRQDLMAEQLSALKESIDDLLADMTANSITNKEETGTLMSLSDVLLNIADKNISLAAKEFRGLAEASAGTRTISRADFLAASDSVDQAARELAIQILQVGYAEATEVMAREFHAITEKQAVLRLDTMALNPNTASAQVLTQERQIELAAWLDRLLHSLPPVQETEIKEALVAFNLSRISKELHRDKVSGQMRDSAGALSEGNFEAAAGGQIKIIRQLLAAEFRLRLGAELDTLIKANQLADIEIAELRRLQENIHTLSDTNFEQDRNDLSARVKDLHDKLELLLLPEFPARRPHLLETTFPDAPPAREILTDADNALVDLMTQLKIGSRDQALAASKQAASAFDSLQKLIQDRQDVINERSRLGERSSLLLKYAGEVETTVERLLALLEETEDAADRKEINAAHIAPKQEKLIGALTQMTSSIRQAAQDLSISDSDITPLIVDVGQGLRLLERGLPYLEQNKPDEAIELQDQALQTYEALPAFIHVQASALGKYSKTLGDLHVATRPISFLKDIRDEQLDLIKAIKTAKPEELKELAVIQKNLVHAVNAVLYSLEGMMHKIESGTTMLFAKEDMDAAAKAIEVNDLLEAEDAGSFVAESLTKLIDELAAVIPEYEYIVELTEYFAEESTLAMNLRAELSQVAQSLSMTETATAEELATLNNLAQRLGAFSTQHKTITDSSRYQSASREMLTAIELLNSKDTRSAVKSIKRSAGDIAETTIELSDFLEKTAALLDSPEQGEEPPEEVQLLLDALTIASRQTELTRLITSESSQDLAPMIVRQETLSAPLAEMIIKSKTHKIPIPPEFKPKKGELSTVQPEPVTSHVYLSAAEGHMSKAVGFLKSGKTEEVLAEQILAQSQLRFFILDYINHFVSPAGSPPASDPVVSDANDPPEEDMFMIFQPGSVSGKKPADGKQEWQVLGQRQRAALNENFARELPLEYRSMLKTYYERLAK